MTSFTCSVSTFPPPDTSASVCASLFPRLISDYVPEPFLHTLCVNQESYHQNKRTKVYFLQPTKKMASLQTVVNLLLLFGRKVKLTWFLLFSTFMTQISFVNPPHHWCQTVWSQGFPREMCVSEWNCSEFAVFFVCSLTKHGLSTQCDGTRGIVSSLSSTVRTLLC